MGITELASPFNGGGVKFENFEDGLQFEPSVRMNSQKSSKPVSGAWGFANEKRGQQSITNDPYSNQVIKLSDMMKMPEQYSR